MISIMLIGLILLGSASPEEPKDFDKMWKEVERLEKNGLARKADDLVLKIYELAKASHDSPHLLKATQYHARLLSSFEENNDLVLYKWLINENEHMPTEVDVILHQYQIAEFLRAYLVNNRYNLRNRTAVPSNSTQTPLTDRDATSIEQEISILHDSILSHADALSDIPLSQFSDVISLGKSTEHVIPTLFDFILHQLIEYYSEYEPISMAAIDSDPIDWNDQIKSYQDWSPANRSIAESPSKEHKVLAIYYRLIESQKDYTSHSPLLYTEFNRLNFIASGFSEEVDVSNRALEDLYQQYLKIFEKDAEVGLFYYSLASMKLSQADEISLETTLDKDSAGALRQEAMSYLSLVDTTQKTYALEFITPQKNSLKTPLLELKAEAYYPKNVRPLVSIDHKGISSTNVRLYPVTTDELIQWVYNYQYSKEKDRLAKLKRDKKPIYKDQWSLTDKKNYTTYSSEFLLPPLDYGIYLVLVEGIKDELLSYALIQVSDMMITKLDDQSAYDLLVTHRQSGAPLENVEVRLHDYKNENTDLDVVNQIATTNSKGLAHLTMPSRRSMVISARRGDDILVVLNQAYSYYYDRNAPSKTYHADIFTDRGIYRPGQSVFFKTILYSRASNLYPTLLMNEPLEVRVTDPNGQEVVKMNLVTNEFGSASGEFKLPTEGLRGTYNLQINQYGYQHIQVEEYKRPNFEVELSTDSSALAFDVPVKILGMAKSYANVPIQEAVVRYRVIRKSRPIWRWFMPYAAGGTALIEQGQVQTDQDGHFKIDFIPAKPSNATSSWRQSMYTYEVVAEVTDGTGETRKGTTQVLLSDQSVFIHLTTTTTIDVENFHHIDLRATNIMGQEVQADVHVEIARLNHASSTYLNRLWSAPDYPVSDAQTFNQNYPYLSIDGDASYDHWSVDKTIVDQHISIKNTTSIEIKNSRRKAGVYRIKVMNSEGDVLYTDYLVVTDRKKNEWISNEALSTQLDQLNYQPGDDAVLWMHSPIKNAQVYVQVEKSGRIVQDKWIDLHSDHLFTMPVTEADRGGFLVHLFLFQHGRMIYESIRVDVPWSNKQLNIEWETIRNILMPGQEEEWILKVTDENEAAVIAEIMASMYDASLDAFLPFQWRFDLWPNYSSRYYPSQLTQLLARIRRQGPRPIPYNYSSYTFPSWLYPIDIFSHEVYDAVPMMSRSSNQLKQASQNMTEESAEMAYDDAAPAPSLEAIGGADEVADFDFNPRTNLDETVFFLPQLKTDEKGRLSLHFTMNEALTQWKLQLIAHTMHLACGYDVQEIVTQKDLMIQPEVPRFLKEGDEIVLRAKINRLTDQPISGKASLDIRDAVTGELVTNDFTDIQRTDFSLMDSDYTIVTWRVKVPVGRLNPLEIVFKADGGHHTDGEQHTIPVMTNRILVTETQAFNVRGDDEKIIDVSILRDAQNADIDVVNYTLEFMENPVWFAIQSLPYLSEYPYDCSEQIAHRIYANALAHHITRQFPDMSDIFQQWQNRDELISNLNKNQELKSALIEETPWLRNAQSEEEQMRRILFLFDKSRIQSDYARDLFNLMDRQSVSGGFPWFEGGRDNVYITQTILQAFGHLRSLHVPLSQEEVWQPMIRRAIDFSLNQMQKRYLDLNKSQKEKNEIDPLSLNLIYVMSFFMDIVDMPDSEAWSYYFKAGQENWTDRSEMIKAMIATAYYRFDSKSNLSKKIVASFLDRAIRSEELGMYWKNNNHYSWYNRPIETHAMIMEAIHTIDPVSEDLDEMRLWLLRHKQTNQWDNTIATAQALYALLIRGDDWLHSTTRPNLTIGSQSIEDSGAQTLIKPQAGTGYQKYTWPKEKINDKISKIHIKNPTKTLTWGGVYVQYWQTIDQVKSMENNPLHIQRGLFKKVWTDDGPQLIEIADETKLKIGDKAVIRLRIESDRMMEFIHIKDLRAASFEPVDVISGYEYEGGLGYYQSTTDLATHFFIDRLSNGVYVLEYEVNVTNEGEFSGGMSTIQCMYAPEFTGHSEGRRVEVLP